MTDTTIDLPRENVRANALAETLSVLLGTGVTLALFLGVAHFDGPAPAPEPALTELRMISLPAEAPPPKPVETPVAAAPATPLAGLEIGSNDSSVKIAVVPPDLASLVPADTVAPAARIEPAQLITEFKPRVEIEQDISRIYQAAEVDQKPAPISRPKPNIPAIVRGNAKALSVFVVFVVDARGAISNVRVLNSSGNQYFDDIIVRDVRDSWVFAPAMKKGKKVRCLIQQNVRVEWTNASPFETN